MKRRNRTEVRRDIIMAVAEERVPTRIYYKAGVAWKSFRMHMESLIADGLIVCTPPKSRDKRTLYDYRLTDKGRQVAARIRELDALWRILE